MKKIINKLKNNRTFISTIGMIVGTFIYCFAIVFILDLGKFYAGGVTGISQIFANLLEQPYLKSVIIGVVNLPLFIMGWKGVSKRFAILSLASVLLQVVLTALFDYMKLSLNINPFESLQGNILVLSLFGGALTGLGCGIALRYGTSTGGMDIVSQRFALSSKIPFSIISGGIDAVIIIVGALMPGGNIAVAVYTIIRLVIHVIVLDKVHSIYKFQKISITTLKKEEITKALVENFVHGVTIYEAVGGYSGKTRWVIESVVLTYELEDYRKVIHSVDDKAFISYTSIKGVDGNYTKKVIN